MSTLQKFKLLATQCAVAGSPTRSPAASPVIHLRRRKTLRMLLGRGGGNGGRRRVERGEMSLTDRRGSSDEGSALEKGGEFSVRQKLKDLFVLSPPAFGGSVSENVRDGFTQPGGGAGGSGDGVRGNGARMVRPITATFRQRLLRRAWRPVLVAIPE
ncbi:uncharacterized protein [Primulina eburnea]|uniref:uncharacterized protein n=1 Tax=Primulina eburnea TaxID=1245227 RepID=UPI003C6C8747